jgi:chromosomal replication initiator protein
MEHIWKKALANLSKEVNEQVFTSWFQPMKQVFYDKDSVTLSVPNKFFENWVRDKYYSLIKNSLENIKGGPVTVSFKIVRDPSPQPSPRAGAARVADEKNNSVTSSSKNWIRSVFSPSKPHTQQKKKTIELNPNYTFDTFVVGSSNRFAHAASLAVCERLSKVYNPLFLYGGVGLGKTHLMQAMGHDVLTRYPRAKVLYISSEEFTNHLISSIRNKTTDRFRSTYRNVDVLLIDDIQFIAGKESTQEEFFHTFNSLHDAHKQIVICSDRSPQEIKGLEERLVSRFAWGLIADIQSPDFETRMAIIEKKSENEDIEVPKDVLYFLAEHIKTNIREMEGALIRVVAYAKLTGEKMTIDLAKNVLKGMIVAEERKITIPQIQRIVADYFGINDSDMKTKKRTRAVAYPRQLAMYISRKLTDLSLPDIGEQFGGRDHTTVLHAFDKISREIKATEKTDKLIRTLTQKVKNND